MAAAHMPAGLEWPRYLLSMALAGTALYAVLAGMLALLGLLLARGP